MIRPQKKKKNFVTATKNFYLVVLNLSVVLFQKENKSIIWVRNKKMDNPKNVRDIKKARLSISFHKENRSIKCQTAKEY